VNDMQVPDEYGQSPISSERTFPTAPFPRKYIHSALNDLQHAVQAVQALRAAGCAAGDIHLMASWDFVEAVEQQYQQRNAFSKALTRMRSLIDEAFGDVYLREACRGSHILMIYLPQTGQIERVCHLLTVHHAHLVKYADTWTISTLVAAPPQPSPPRRRDTRKKENAVKSGVGNAEGEVDRLKRELEVARRECETLKETVDILLRLRP